MTPQQLLAILNDELTALELSERAPLNDDAARLVSFDDLIVNSLDALQVVMRLEEATGRELTLSELRNFPSVMDALAYLSSDSD